MYYFKIIMNSTVHNKNTLYHNKSINLLDCLPTSVVCNRQTLKTHNTKEIKYK